MTNIKKEIIDKLHQAEREHNIKVILAVESGSRAWGFASSDSDYDCRFIYTRSKDNYITIQNKPDFLEYELNSVYDISGWDITKVMKQAIKPNTVLLEWLTSDIIYMSDDSVTELRKLALDYFNPKRVCYHYLNMAKKRNELITSGNHKLKHYFYALRTLANIQYILHYQTMPPIDYFETIQQINLDPELITEIKKLRKLKQDGVEAEQIEPNSLLLEYFNSQLEISEQQINELQFKSNYDLERCDKILLDIVNSYEPDTKPNRK